MSSPTLPVPAAERSVAVIVCAYTMDRWVDVVEAYESLVKQSRPADEIVPNYPVRGRGESQAGSSSRSAESTATSFQRATPVSM